MIRRRTAAARTVLLALSVILALSVLLPMAAHAFSGSATLTGTSVVAVRGCGRGRAALTTVLAFADDGTWTAGSEEGATFAGTYAARGRSGRRYALTLNAPSEQALAAGAVTDITMLCDATGVTVTESRAKVVTLTLAKKGTLAKLLVKYLLRGSANGRSGTATLRITGKGPWTPG